ncbi:MAG: hypothetical protein IJ383_08500 [Bacteroidales bacterium]|nr:hypothetical protein [Bacteroidales bacterium]
MRHILIILGFLLAGMSVGVPHCPFILAGTGESCTIHICNAAEYNTTWEHMPSDASLHGIAQGSQVNGHHLKVKGSRNHPFHNSSSCSNRGPATEALLHKIFYRTLHKSSLFSKRCADKYIYPQHRLNI